MKLIDMTQDLIRMNSVSDQSNEEVITYIQKELEALDFTTELLRYNDSDGIEKMNLVAKLGEGEGGLAFLCHSDTVPGQEEDWDPFEPIIKEDRLYGRGSCDMKGPIASVLTAVNGIKKEELKNPLWVIVTSDEEIGCEGAEFVVKNSQMLKDNCPRFGIATEPTGLIPVYAHKGWGALSITALGKAAHSSTGLGDSSLFKIAPFLSEMAELNELFLKDERYMNREFDPPTNGFNMILENGNTKVNVTSPKTVCRISFRVMPNAAGEEIIQIITDKAEKRGLRVSSVLNEAVYTDPQSELVQGALDITGVKKAITVPYNTDAFHFQNLMDVIVLGPGSINQAHTVGEYIDLTELKWSVNVYKGFIKRFCL